jgi:hypothetical protein
VIDEPEEGVDMTAIDHGSFAEALVVYARQEIARDQGLKAHPTPEKLAAYHADELSETEDLEIQRHLAICSECPALLIDLEDLFEPRQRDLGLSDTGVASAWQDLRSRLGGKGRTGGPRVAVKTPWWAWFSAALKSPVLASGLAVLCLGLSVSLFNLRESQVRPLGNPLTVEIRNEQTRSGDEPLSLTRIPLAADHDGMILDLVISPLAAERYQRFDGVILNAKNRVVHPFSGRLQQETNELRVTLDRKLLKPGLYKIEVFGFPRRTERPLETFPIEVVHI